MKKFIGLVSISAVVFLGASLSFGQGHLLITEFAVTPTPGEFVEIYNPTPDSVDLSNYYITDATFAGGGTYYYNIVTGDGGGGGFGDFNARFPAGAKIGPGEYQTIAILGDSLFFDQYNVLPTYELYEDGSNFASDVPDMLEATAGSIDDNHAGNVQFGALSTGEVLILYYWDGVSDLVKDVDYVVWQDKAEAVDKTGVSIDGPDAGEETSTYAADTAIADQTTVNADNDGDGNAHDSDKSAQRVLPVEDLENWTGGNGITGHDETSENTSWKGGIWSINAPATPNAAALSESPSIQSLNFIRADDIGPDANDDSPQLGDTLSVTGIVMQDMREIFLGSRWGGFIMEESGGPWSGFFVIQNDTSTAGVAGTLLTATVPGDTIKITGIVSEFQPTPNTPSITQFVLITDPVTPIEFVGPASDPANPGLPDLIVLTPGDLGLNAAGTSADVQLSERWEGVLARFEDLTILANGLPGNTMTATDASGTIILDDYFSAVSNAVTNNGNVWPDLPAGTKINVTGFVRGGTSSGLITINPRTLADIEIASSPPEISNASRTPTIPTAAEAVTVSAVIQDAQGAVATATVDYRVDGGAFQKVDMATGGGSSQQAVINFADSLYSADIPAQADGALVEYFLTAADDTADSTRAPATGNFFYYVRDAGPTIRDVQFTPFANGNSGAVGLPITVTGIATTDSADFSFYWIQDGTDPWSGVLVLDNVNNVNLGDEVEVTGTVGECFGQTQINNVTSANVLSSGNTLPDPLMMNTGDINTGAAGAESYEGMFVRVENAEVINERPDGFPGFGEFTVNDGSGELRIDDLSAIFQGQTSPDTAFHAGERYAIQGILDWTFGNFKIQPRNNDDLDNTTGVEDDNLLGVPFTYELKQNYPNPFNPETSIQYSLANKGAVSLTVFNLMGQKVRTLIDKDQPAGNYEVRWNGLNDQRLKVASGIYFYRFKSGDFTKIQKMLLLK
ncbi:lamin tail domain-containing protein [candidate division KSB1 bacterium]|nr:lamin tail domain-containing protein [candidate division KSB1 bacterium]